MRPLNLDFAGRPSRLRQASVVLLIIAIATATWLGKIYLDRSAELERWEAKWRTLQNQQARDTKLTPDNGVGWEQMQAELKTANRVIAQLSLPWDALFREVESSVNQDVTLLSVEPDVEKREVRIMAETSNFAAMLEYEKRLLAVALFKDAHIVSHQIQAQDPQRPVRFVVNAQWRHAE